MFSDGLLLSIFWKHLNVGSDGDSPWKYLAYGRCFWWKTWKATIENGASFAWRLQQWTSCMMGTVSAFWGFHTNFETSGEKSSCVVAKNFLHSSLTHACFEDTFLSALYFSDEPLLPPNPEALRFLEVPAFSRAKRSFHCFHAVRNHGGLKQKFFMAT